MITCTCTRISTREWGPQEGEAFGTCTKRDRSSTTRINDRAFRVGATQAIIIQRHYIRVFSVIGYACSVVRLCATVGACTNEPIAINWHARHYVSAIFIKTNGRVCVSYIAYEYAYVFAIRKAQLLMIRHVRWPTTRSIHEWLKSDKIENLKYWT